jgi:hypothetical protein
MTDSDEIARLLLTLLRKEEHERETDEALIYKYFYRNVIFPDSIRHNVAQEVRTIEAVGHMLEAMGIPAPTASPAVKVRARKAISKISKIDRQKADDFVMTLVSSKDVTTKQAQAFVARHIMKWNWGKVADFMGGNHHSTAQEHYQAASLVLNRRHIPQNLSRISDESGDT